MKLHNLTNHNQLALSALDLSKHNITEVEVEPRLRLIEDPTDFQEMKEAVKEAVQGINSGEAVLVGGLGQLQSLIQQLPFRIFFADFNFAKKQVEGVFPFEGFSRQELYDIENQNV